MNTKSFAAMLAAVFFFTGCGMATGEKAITKMSPEEKTFMSEILMKVKPETSETELVKILGEPKRGGGTVRPVWQGPGNNEKSQVAFYYLDGKIFKIRWIKLGEFIWERDLK